MLDKSTAAPQPNDATMAAYYLYGAEAGIFGEAEVKSWAYFVIESREPPPVEIIELAMSHGREQLFENLKNVRGQSDIQLAGRWLLGILKEEFKKNPSKMQLITRKAMQIARSTNQPDAIHHRFDGIDDEIFLAMNNTYGTLELCRLDLEEALAPYEQYKQTKPQHIAPADVRPRCSPSRLSLALGKAQPK